MLAGVTVLMGVVTAEALYPATYTTHENEISDLGATRPPFSISRQPSAEIFNTAMIVSGAMVLSAAALLHRAGDPRRITIPIAALGTGTLGVGLFPGSNETFHPLFATLAFVSGGAAAILSSDIQEIPVRYLSRFLGAIALGALLVGIAGESTFAFEELGDGGVERWIVYPVVLWMTAFGGWLTGRRIDQGIPG
jgi:hypothetical membrane protein